MYGAGNAIMAGYTHAAIVAYVSGRAYKKTMLIFG
jgi:hypothetical protein